jgi:hypothetical protein
MSGTVKRYVICGFLYNEDDARALMAELDGKILGVQLIELEPDDILMMWSHVKEVLAELKAHAAGRASEKPSAVAKP